MHIRWYTEKPRRYLLLSVCTLYFLFFFFLLGPLYSIRNLAPALALPAREMLWWRGGREGSSLIGTSHWLALSRKHHHNSKSASSMLGPKHKKEISVLVNPELGRCHSHHSMAWGRADASHCLHTISFIFYLNLKKLLSLSFGFGLQVSGTGHFTWSVRTKSCCVCVRMSVCVCQCVCVLVSLSLWLLLLLSIGRMIMWHC